MNRDCAGMGYSHEQLQAFTIQDEMQERIDFLESEVSRLQKERDMWKANHDNQRNLKAAIINRLDCGDRARKVVALFDRIQELETAIKNVIENSLVEHEGNWNKCHFNVEEKAFKQLISLA